MFLQLHIHPRMLDKQKDLTHLVIKWLQTEALIRKLSAKGQFSSSIYLGPEVHRTMPLYSDVELYHCLLASFLLHRSRGNLNSRRNKQVYL